MEFLEQPDTRDQLDLTHGVTLEDYQAWSAEHSRDITQDPPYNRSAGHPLGQVSVEAQALLGQRIASTWREVILGDW